MTTKILLIWLMGTCVMYCQEPIEILKVVSSVNLQESALIPGGLTTILVRGIHVDGTLKPTSYPAPTELGGIRVNIYGRPAPILRVQPSDENVQVDVQVSWSADPEVRPAVEVVQGDRSVVQQGAPEGVWDAILLDDRGNALAYHLPDYTPLTPENPLRGGDHFVIFAANMGEVTQQPEDGAVTPDPAPDLIQIRKTGDKQFAKGALLVEPPPGTAGNPPSYYGLSALPLGRKALLPGYVGLYALEYVFGDVSPPQMNLTAIQLTWATCTDGGSISNIFNPCKVTGLTTKPIPIPVEPCDLKYPSCSR